jgi:hypothetical protein
VLDASLSTRDAFIDDAKTALGAYLSHFAEADAKVELLTFDRTVARHLGGFLDVNAALRAVASLTIARRNGSDVDLALAEADKLLSAAPRGAARRIVLLTDGLTRAELTPERLRAALSRSGAVTHAGLLESGSPQLTRFDDHPWARGLRPNGGLVWNASASVESDARELRQVFEEWARPVRLDNLVVYSPELSLQTNLEALPKTLDEGQGLENLGLEHAAAPWLALEGELWTTPVRASLGADAKQEKLWSALVFGSGVLGALSEPEMMTLARRGKAVSPVTSHLAIEPGVRPSTEGLDHGGGGFGEGIGLGSVNHFVHGQGASRSCVSGSARPGVAVADALVMPR